MSIAYIDLETSINNTQTIYDYGAEKDGKILHTTDIEEFKTFISDTSFLCGHNIIKHDLVALSSKFDISKFIPIDTLYLSPLLYPEKDSYELGKEEKLFDEQSNNPLTDSIKAKDLFLKEICDFNDLPENLKQIYTRILINTNEFRGFFKYINAEIPNNENFISLLKLEFQNLLCENANFNELINDYPIELAYALSIIKNNKESINISKWVTNNFQSIYKVIETLRNIPCNNCSYCSTNLNIFYMLNHIFKYPSFRKYGNKPLQEQAAQSAINGESLLAIFPTGGGKSITFQLPALMQGKAVNGLTVVISPLQSLMKDQIDDLKKFDVTNATTINGLLDPIERKANFNLLIENKVNLIYIAPESLRSESMKNALFEQNIIRFVIDEAHCFSTWGQEFRVDYQYIGNFINEYQEKAKKNIPVSCFTATAKQQVIQDITNYFKDRLDKDLQIYEAESKRENLHYDIVECKDNEEKYKKIRDILSVNKVPTIIYCARTKKTIEIADRLTKEGIEAKAFNGKMSLQEKKDNMEAFMNNKVSVIVATSAFGMGVNKKDVKLVIHYDISDSLENYIQEAGRAGRSQEIQADCLILFNKDDANKHFNLLNKTKLTFNEIYNLWNNIKKTVPEPGKPSDAPRFVSSPALAKESGWQRGEEEVDTSIKTAVSILEQRNYVKRCNNKYIVKATSINKDIGSFADGDRIINEFKDLFKEDELKYAKQILSALVSNKYKELAGNENTKPNAELLAYRLGIPEISVINCINKMRNIGVIADANDMTVYLSPKTTNDSMHKILEKYFYIWQSISQYFVDGIFTLNIKDINEKLISYFNTPKKTYIKDIKNILYFLIEKEYIKKKRNTHNDNNWNIKTLISVDKLNEISNLRNNICKYIINRLYSKLDRVAIYNQEKVPVHFSHKELLEEHHIRLNILTEEFDITNEALDEALLYLVRCNILNISGNFLVLYNRLGVKRLNLDNRKRFTQDDYDFLDNFYKQKTHQIHIANKYCNIMLENPQKAEEFALDYFKLSEKNFLEKYFTKQERKEIDRNITAEKYNEIFGKLSEEQLEVMNDSDSHFIVVAAGPGSGKTRLLVHKLASLLTVEQIPAEQLLMLTFSRTAATEFKIRLRKLVPNLTNIAIKTFHSFCFDLLGRKGDLISIKKIIPLATELIKANQVEPKSISKQVIVIDEAQDIDENEYYLLETLIEKNENIKIIAVGDDDQNIYEFRKSNSKYMSSFLNKDKSKKYELTTNYRSAKEIIDFSNYYIKNLKALRLKENDIKPISEEKKGVVKITKYYSPYFEENVINELVNLTQGSKCIATNTNKEALIVISKLLERGIKAKLIQSNDGFNLYNLLEIRDFLTDLKWNNKSPQITQENWDKSVSYIKEKYKYCPSLEIIVNIFEKFNKANPKYKYKTDFEEFIKESSLDSFYKPDEDTVYVSTIHQTKGREFDYVFILLKNINIFYNDETIRQLYVGFTRAKNLLSIHTNINCSAFKNLKFVEYTENKIKYPAPNKIILNLTLGNVYLDYFKPHKKLIMKLKPGNSLHYEKNNTFSVYLKGQKYNIMKLEKDTYKDLQAKIADKWIISKVYIRFIVAYKFKTEPNKEYAVIIPTIELQKNDFSTN